MKRLLSLLSIILCIGICISSVGCNSVDNSKIDSASDTVSLDSLSTYLNNKKPEVTVKTDEGDITCYVLGNTQISGKDTTLACNEENIKKGETYQLYFQNEKGEQVLATAENLSSVTDGDTVKIGTYNFKYLAASASWEAISDGYFETDTWDVLHMSSAAVQSASCGCQWTLALAIDQGEEGSLALMSADISGIFKSTDSGKTWHPSNRGLEACGSNSIAIDPKNPNHVVATANNSNSSETSDTTALHDASGLVVSYDGGDTWKHVLNTHVYSQRDQRIQITFDETSYDAEKNMCTTVYWSQENYSNAVTGGIWKSTDGGETWSKISTEMGQCQIEMTSDGKAMYALNIPLAKTEFVNPAATLYKSTDGGISWNTLSINDTEGTIRTFDIIRDNPSNVYATTADGFYMSTDYGESWTQLNTASTLPTQTQYLAVSKNGQNMSLQAAKDDSTSPILNYYSTDGGVTWAQSTNNIAKTAFMPITYRRSVRMFAGNGNDRILGILGDSIIGSDNGGKTWITSNRGYDVICTEKIEFNVNNPNLVLIPSQDFNGCFSTDAGETWKYLMWQPNSWGGMTYGGYILDKDTMFVCCTQSGNQYNSTIRTIYMTYDGGDTFDRTGKYSIDINSDFESLGALNNNKIAFIGNLRTTDGARTFKAMDTVYDQGGNLVDGAQCFGVWCIDHNTGRLYGRDNKNYLVYSDDNGASWTQFEAYTKILYSMSCDKDGNIYYTTTTNTNNGTTAFYKTTVDTDATTLSKPAIFNFIQGRMSVLVDFYSPDVIYMSSSRSFYASKNGNPRQTVDYSTPCAIRSTDGGETWVDLNLYDDGSGNTYTDTDYCGPRCVYNIIMNYAKNKVWFVSYCSGIWTIERIKQ